MSKHSFFQRAKQYLWRFALIFFVLFTFLVIYLDSLVKNEFKQQAWSIPAKVYARPLAFSEGKKLLFSDLKAELNLLGYRQKIKAVNQGEFEKYSDSKNQNTLVINTRRFQFWDGVQPEQVLEVTINNGVVTKLKDFSTQKKVNYLRLDPLPLGNIQASNSSSFNNEDRQLVTLSELPDYFIPT